MAGRQGGRPIAVGVLDVREGREGVFACLLPLLGCLLVYGGDVRWDRWGGVFGLERGKGWKG